MNDPTGGAATLSTAAPVDFDLKRVISAIRPLGDTADLIRRAVDDSNLFVQLLDLFLVTAPHQSDPIHRIADGVNHALYQLAKAVLHARPEMANEDFQFDDPPMTVQDAVREAFDRLEALDEYTEGRTAEATPLRKLLEEAEKPERISFDLAESILKRSIAIGGRYGLDAANLLGFIKYRRGDLDGAELLFDTVLRREASDAYERETQAHAMNNLTGVHLGRQDLKSAILWCERSLMVKERLGIDARSNYLNLTFFWIENGTAYGLERSRHYVQALISLDGGQEYLEQTLASPSYDGALRRFQRAGLNRDFPELDLADPGEAKASTQDEVKERENSG